MKKLWDVAARGVSNLFRITKCRKRARIGRQFRKETIKKWSVIITKHDVDGKFFHMTKIFMKFMVENQTLNQLYYFQTSTHSYLKEKFITDPSARYTSWIVTRTFTGTLRRLIQECSKDSMQVCSSKDRKPPTSTTNQPEQTNNRERYLKFKCFIKEKK